MDVSKSLLLWFIMYILYIYKLFIYMYIIYRLTVVSHVFPVGALEHVLCFHILGVIFPTDELIFSEGLKPPTSMYIYIHR